MSLPQQSLLDTLETAVAGRSIGSRADILRRVTDLFAAGSATYNDEQRALFDDVMGRLIVELDAAARAAFGERLAEMADAPINVVRTLASDDEIKVAGPILTRSERLDDQTLIASAKTKSQDHLLAISKRRTLREGVTDVLVERGDHQVVLSTASNGGAQFSEFGYSTLVTRSKFDDGLALAVLSRQDVPRKHLLELLSTASDAVRQKFEIQDWRKSELVRNMIRHASDCLQKQSREMSSEFVAAQTAVDALHSSGKLTDDTIREFASSEKFNEVVLSLARLSDMPIGAIERAITHKEVDQLLLVARAIDLSWEAAKSILLMRGINCQMSHLDLVDHQTRFVKLQPQTARTTLQFFRLRDKAAN